MEAGGSGAGGWWESWPGSCRLRWPQVAGSGLNGGERESRTGDIVPAAGRWPSVQESSIYGEIQGVEAVEAGGFGGVSAGGGWPGSCRLRWPASGGGESWPTLQGILHLRRG